MAFSHENHSGNLLPGAMSRRDFFRLAFLALSCPALYAFPSESFAQGPLRTTLIEEFLGEQLDYQIGFWLISHCGKALVKLCKSPHRGIYVAQLTGKTVGLVDWLVGRYRYSYLSYSGYDEKADRLFPLYFKLVKRRKDKVSTRTVTFNYKDQELIFASSRAGTQSHKIIRMRQGILYEDYLTLFYNFRHGYYGAIQRGMTYHLPLHIHEGFDFLDLTVGSKEEEEVARSQELNPKGKDFFVRFRVLKEDVSSKSGKIVGWLSRDAVPVKGVIKDVIFFGDLWGVLIDRRFTSKYCKKTLLS